MDQSDGGANAFSKHSPNVHIHRVAPPKVADVWWFGQ